MIWMLLGISVGWTVSSNSSHPIRDKKQLLINVTVTIIHVRKKKSNTHLQNEGKKDKKGEILNCYIFAFDSGSSRVVGAVV